MVGIVLGSGLGSLTDEVKTVESVNFAEAGLKTSTVPGHEGKFVFGSIFGSDVLLMKGRVHLYEGHSAADVTAGVRWMANRGVKRLILTNAAGTLNRHFKPGCWMALSDHLNLTGTSPLCGPDFVDMSEVYSSLWRNAFLDSARRQNIDLYEGVYAGLRGPQYETPAEIRMLGTMGADAVGMSTVLEAIQARSLGLEVAGFSCLTNWAAGLQAHLDHSEVLETGMQAAASMKLLLQGVFGEG